MPLSSEEISAAEKTHDFVRWYENQQRRAVWISWSAILLLMLISMDEIRNGHVAWGCLMLGLGIGFAFMGVLGQMANKAHYRHACLLLKVLEREHGDQLPWVEVEKHLAAVKELEQELANRHVAP